MKKLNIFIVLLSLVMAVSCGDDKKKSKGDNANFYDLTQNPYQAVAPSVVNGLFNPQSGLLEVGGQSFQPNQVFGYQQGAQQQFPQQQYQGQQVGQMSFQCPQTQQMAQQLVMQGQQFLNSAYQQIVQSQQNFSLRPAYQANGVVKFNVRVTYYVVRCPGSNTNSPVLTAPVVAF